MLAIRECCCMMKAHTPPRGASLGQLTLYSSCCRQSRLEPRTSRFASTWTSQLCHCSIRTEPRIISRHTPSSELCLQQYRQCGYAEFLPIPARMLCCLSQQPHRAARAKSSQQPGDTPVQ